MPATISPQSSIKRKIPGGTIARKIALALYLAAMTARLAWIRIKCGRSLLVLFRSGGLGDVLATSPAVLALRERHPDRHIVYCTRPEFRGVVELVSGVDTILGIYHGDQLAALIARWFDTRRFRYRDEYDSEGSTRHFMLEMADSAGVGLPDGATPRIEVAPIGDEEFHSWFGAHLAGRSIVALHAGPSAPVREWPIERWRVVAEKLALRPEIALVQIGSGRHFLHGERDIAIAGALQPRRAFSFLESARLLKRAVLMIGIDSGPLHLAAAVGTSSIGIFGPVDPRLRAPAGSQHIVVRSRLACQFCHHRIPRGHWETGCPHSIACLKEIEPGDVLDIIEASLSTSR